LQLANINCLICSLIFTSSLSFCKGQRRGQRVLAPRSYGGGRQTPLDGLTDRIIPRSGILARTVPVRCLHVFIISTTDRWKTHSSPITKCAFINRRLLTAIAWSHCYDDYTGCLFLSVSSSNCEFWHIAASMVLVRITSLATLRAYLSPSKTKTTLGVYCSFGCSRYTTLHTWRPTDRAFPRWKCLATGLAIMIVAYIR